MNPASTLRRARKRVGMTQAALAAQAGTSQATVSAYESGAKRPSIATLVRLLDAAGSRLSVEPADAARRPGLAEHARTARTLGDVLALAEALPVRHQPDLDYPRLKSRSAAG